MYIIPLATEPMPILDRRAFVEHLLSAAAAAAAGTVTSGSRRLRSRRLTPVAAASSSDARAAQKWVEALPIGSGRLGAMVFGGVGTERLQLNDDTLWSGGPKDRDNPKAREVLPQVRRAVAAGRFVEADTLAKGLQGPYTQTYLPMGDLVLAFEHGDIGARLPPRRSICAPPSPRPASASATCTTRAR